MFGYRMGCSLVLQDNEFLEWVSPKAVIEEPGIETLRYESKRLESSGSEELLADKLVYYHGYSSVKGVVFMKSTDFHKRFYKLVRRLKDVQAGGNPGAHVDAL
jgi:hypothetical protein